MEEKRKRERESWENLITTIFGKTMILWYKKRRVEMKDVKGKKCSFLCGYLISLSLAISTGKPKVT